MSRAHLGWGLPKVLFACTLALGLSSHAQTVHAQQEETLASARKLFADALRAEEKGNYTEALEKFRRVMKVKDTAPVRYRIGACLEGLGKLKDAMQAYQSAIDLAARDAKDIDIVRSAKEHTSELDERIPRLTLTPSEHARPSAEVLIDGAPIPSGELGQPIALEPGEHAVSASAPGATPFQTQVTLPERARLAIVVPLDPAAPAVPVAPRDTSSPPPPREHPSDMRKTAGWISTGVGGAFLLAAGVTLVLRESAISTLNDACPNGACPRSREDELTSTQSRARTEGTLAVVFAGLGVVGVGIGTYLLLTPHHSDSGSSSGDHARAHGGEAHAIEVGGRATPGGGQMVLTTRF